jgi:DNA-binding CsgD family transcriptional regulator
VLISNSIGRQQAEKAALAGTLTQMGAAIFIVDASGSLCFSNDKADRMISQGDILRRSQSDFAAVDPYANTMLQRGLTAVRLCAREVRLGGVTIPLTQLHDERWLAHIVSLNSLPPQPSSCVTASAAAVLVRKASFNTAAALETLMSIYRLTAMEGRVLQAVVEIGGTPSIAVAFGISETTVKTHLRAVFDKTDVRRQADLVKLVASHASPFAE